MEDRERPIRHDVAMAVAILLLGFLLLGLGVLLLNRWQVSAERNQVLMFGDAVGFAATAAGLAIVTWWLFSLLLALASALCLKSGRETGARITGRLSPVFMRRLALAVLGLNLLGAPLAQAAPSVEAAWSPAGTSASISAAWTPLLPAEGSSPSRVAALQRAGAQSPAPGPIEARWQPLPPVVEPGLMGAKVTRAAQQSATPGIKEIVVLRGDSLWSIAARDLGPMAGDLEIARHWPKWYAANRDVIGDDPGLLVPGQILQAPHNK